MSEVFDVKTVTIYPGDPGGDDKKLFVLRAPSAAHGGAVSIIAAEAVQPGTASLSHGVGGTTFTLALHKYTNATTPALYGTVAASVGGTAEGWGAGRVKAFTIDTAGTAAQLSAGEYLVLQYNEVNAGNPVNLAVIVRYEMGR